MGNACNKDKAKSSTKVHSESTMNTEGNEANGPADKSAKSLAITKGDFINEHTSQNIREDYQIGKVLGTGAFGEV